MPLIHLKFKLLISGGTRPANRHSSKRTWAFADLTATPSSRKGPCVTPGPDGGVVTQRTANPCTPVRFRLGPPLTFAGLSAAGRWSRAAYAVPRKPGRSCGNVSSGLRLVPEFRAFGLRQLIQHRHAFEVT